MIKYGKYLSTIFKKGDHAQSSKVRSSALRTFNFLRPTPRFKGDATIRKQVLTDGTVVTSKVNTWGLAATVMTFVRSPLLVSIIEEFVFLFENGALELVAGMAEAPPPVGDDPLPLDVYFGTQLSGYFASGGTTAKISSALFHLQGSVSVGETDFLADTATMPSASPYSSDIYKRNNGSRIDQLIQQLEDERFYQLSPITPSVTLSSQYTGIMRLAVQSWLGVGRSPGPGAYISIFSDLISSNASDYPCPHDNPNPFTDGLIHDNDYNFWWVRIGASSITFTKLAPAQFAFAQDILIAGGLSAEQGRKYLLALMSWLQPDTGVEPVVVGITELDDVTGGGRAAVAHGWHFNHSSTWKAAIVTQRVGAGATTSDWYREATQAEITFSFDVSSVPDASLSIITQDQLFVLPLIHTLFYPDASGSFCPLGIPSGVTKAENGESPVPLYCFYTQDNELEILEWTPDLETTKNIFTPSSLWPCCGREDSEVRYGWNTHTVVTGGFACGSVDYSAGNPTGQRVDFTQQSQNVLVSQQTATAAYSDVFLVTTCISEAGGFPTSYDDLDAAVGDPNAEYYTPAGYTIWNSRLDRQQWNIVKNVNSYYQFCIIPSEDAEAIFIGKHIEEVRNSYTITNYSTGAGTYITERFIPDIYWRGPTVGTTWRLAGISWTWMGRANPGNLNVISTETVPGETAYLGETTLVSSRGEFNAGDTYPGYQGCFGYSVEAPCLTSCSGGASLAYTTAGWYKNPDEVEGRYVLDNYPAAMTTDVRWIGDA